MDLALQHADDVDDDDDGIESGLHLAIRRSLVSPRFLYRSTGKPGRLDDYELASRLSYFLTSNPPDARLLQLASRRELSKPGVLRTEAERLLTSPDSSSFVSRFTGQWLGTRKLKDIMPDPRLVGFFDSDREALIAETELFFSEMLRENHPMESFIAPDFSYRNTNLNKIYGGNVVGNSMQRIAIDRDGRHGGILGLASVMMATANGVDTHPVHRGVWVLKNVLGRRVPDPPADVPALAPDTSGATALREQLSKHRESAACSRCHDAIDPLGMVLENFDPVGRWRDHYPLYVDPPLENEKRKQEFYSTIGSGTRVGPEVDAVGRMPDGEQLKDVVELKRYVLNRIDRFSRCVAEKLLVYATGRKTRFSDRVAARDLVSKVQANGNGFRDLVISVVLSDAFLAR